MHRDRPQDSSSDARCHRRWLDFVSSALRRGTARSTALTRWSTFDVVCRGTNPRTASAPAVRRPRTSCAGRPWPRWPGEAWRANPAAQRRGLEGPRPHRPRRPRRPGQSARLRRARLLVWPKPRLKSPCRPRPRGPRRQRRPHLHAGDHKAVGHRGRHRHVVPARRRRALVHVSFPFTFLRYPIIVPNHTYSGHHKHQMGT